MHWHQVASVAEMGEGVRRVVDLHGEAVLLVSHRGRIYAVAARCPHMGGALERGTLTEDGAIVCPLHRSAFDLATGDVKEWTPWPPLVGKALGTVRREKALPVYPVRVEGDAVMMGFGEE